MASLPATFCACAAPHAAASAILMATTTPVFQFMRASLLTRGPVRAKPRSLSRTDCDDVPPHRPQVRKPNTGKAGCPMQRTQRASLYTARPRETWAGAVVRAEEAET